MSEDQQEQEGAGIAEGEVIFNANLLPKTQEFGDGGVVAASATPLQDNLMDKTEMECDISLKSVNSRTKSKSASPSSKRSSKRKRKNRRRREKKAAAATADGTGGALMDDSTGTETEFSQNSEDTKKGEETGTESETTCHDDLEDSSICVEPSITSIPEEDPSSPLLQEPHFPPVDSGIGGVEEAESKEKASGNSKTGPTHSVDTLLQIAKCRILSQILEPENDAVKMTQQDSQEDTDGSSKLVVPPCSPSSLHSINTTRDSRETSVSSYEETQKPVIKNVHFDERPPEIVTMADSSSEKMNQVGEEQVKAKETIALTEAVGGNTGSATSSIASETSAASLLKGSGSSNEDFVETSYHYPSRESVDESIEQQRSNNNQSGINADTFRETIQIFKIQNPVEAKYIGNELDSILTKSLDRFTTLMETAGGAHDIDTSPISVSGATTTEPCKFQEHQDPHTIQITPEDANNTFVINSGSENESFSFSEQQANVESDMEVDESRLSMNTTFIVENVTEEYEKASSPRPLSPGEVMPQAIPDTVSDTDSVATTGHLSMVPEEDEGDVDENSETNSIKNGNVTNLPSESFKQVEAEAQLSTLSQTFSTASCCTVIEKDASVYQQPDITEQSNEAGSSTVADRTDNFLGEDKVSANVPSSASSTKSSVSSPRCQDLNENVDGETAPGVTSRPSTGETFECLQMESELEMGNEEATESVEVFTLHFPSVPLAPPSENNLDSGNGDQLYFGKGTFAELVLPGARDNNNAIKITSPQMRKDWNLTGRETETDSDWLPERRNSLQQVIYERETAGAAATVEVKVEEMSVGSRNDSLKTAEQQPDDKEEDPGDEEANNQGCNCAKMCVIT